MKLTGLTPILNVSDVQGSLAWFEALGWERVFVWGEAGFGAAEPDFASVGSGEQEIFLSLDEQGSRPVWMSWFLPDHAALDAAYARAHDLGYEIAQEPTDEPWGMREFHLRHRDGHTFRIGCGSG